MEATTSFGPVTSHDQVPSALNYLINQLDTLKRELVSRSENQPATDRWLDIGELSEYLPGNPAITTLYSKVQRREIPFRRMGKRLTFLQSEIDNWLLSKKAKTALELAEVAVRHTTRQRRGGHQKV